MKSEFILLKVTRKNYVKMLDTFSLKELNTIPKAFSNNLFWNVAHALVTQQLLHYYLTDNPLRIDGFWVENFKKGTSPTHQYKQSHVDELKDILMSTVDELIEDYSHGKFKTYQPYKTSYGYEIVDFENALEFNNLHEAMHIGYCLALKNEL